MGGYIYFLYIYIQKSKGNNTTHVVGTGTLTKSSIIKSMGYKTINGIRRGNMSRFGLAVRR